jgi:DNA-binding GntR family transcriptional regulator
VSIVDTLGYPVSALSHEDNNPARDAFGSRDGYQKPLPISEMIFRHIAREIVQGSMRPGERLTETRLCEEFKCSRSPLREAIRMLAADGLVLIEPRRGARVVALSERDLSDLYRVRGVIEGLAVQLAAQKGTNAEFAQLTALNEQMLSAISRGDIGEYFALNASFHHAIAQAGENRHVATIQQSVAARSLSPLFQFGNSSPAHFLRSVDDHSGILEALKQRDGELAEERMRAHLDAACREAEDLIRKNVGANGPPADGD